MTFRKPLERLKYVLFRLFVNRDKFELFQPRSFRTPVAKNIKGKQPNTPSKRAKFKKCRRYVTRTENKTPPTLVFSQLFVTKRQTPRNYSNVASLLNGSLPVKEFVFSKTVGLQLATLLNNELFHKYFSRSLTTSVDQLFCRTPLRICLYDY